MTQINQKKKKKPWYGRSGPIVKWKYFNQIGESSTSSIWSPFEIRCIHFKYWNMAKMLAISLLLDVYITSNCAYECISCDNHRKNGEKWGNICIIEASSHWSHPLRVTPVTHFCPSIVEIKIWKKYSEAVLDLKTYGKNWHLKMTWIKIVTLKNPCFA